MTRQHRHQLTYPALWNACDGAMRDAMACHDDIKIPDKRRSSVTKRAVGAMLALQGVGAAKVAETAGGSSISPNASGAHSGGIAGMAYVAGHPRNRAIAWPPHAMDAKGRAMLRYIIGRRKFVKFYRGKAGLIFVQVRYG